MKTVGRILIILAAFALVMGITYVAVNTGTSNSSSSRTTFENRRDGPRPERPEGERTEFLGERAAGLIFGAIKNIGIVAIIVTMIVIPRGWMQRKRRAASIVS